VTTGVIGVTEPSRRTWLATLACATWYVHVCHIVYDASYFVQRSSFCCLCVPIFYVTFRLHLLVH